MRLGAVSLTVLVLAGGPEDARAVSVLVGLPGGMYPNGISPDGSVVVGIGGLGHPSGPWPVRWTASEGLVNLAELPDGLLHRGGARAASAGGSVIVGELDGEPFRWTATGGLPLAPGSGLEGVATAVSADGSVIAGYLINGEEREAFRWTVEAGLLRLGDLSGGDLYSTAADISADGTVIVGVGRTGTGDEAFRWNEESGGMAGLGDLPGGLFRSGSSAVSSNGSVIVGGGTSQLGIEAFRWTAAQGMVGLGDLPGGEFRSSAFAVSGDGSIIVGVGTSPLPEFPSEAFIWDEARGLRSLRAVLIGDFGLDLSGWILSGATGISMDGMTIVGTGYGPSPGNEEAWIAIIPEPSTALLIASGLAALAVGRRAAWERARRSPAPGFRRVAGCSCQRSFRFRGPVIGTRAERDPGRARSGCRRDRAGRRSAGPRGGSPAGRRREPRQRRARQRPRRSRPP